jgi:AcrR family transcriptional regulator
MTLTGNSQGTVKGIQVTVRMEKSVGIPVPNAGREARSEKGEETRERILDAAEKLFARHGFYGVTVRQITRDVGVDVALAHYYFGTKMGLFDAVFLRRAEILNRERVASLNRYEANPGVGGPSVEGVIEAFVGPMLDIWAAGGSGWSNYFALLAQVNNTPDWGGETMARYFDPVIHRLLEVLRTVLPGATEDDLLWCYQFLSGAMLLAFAQTGRVEKLSDGRVKSSDVAAVRARMPRYIAAGFRAICTGISPTAQA